MFCRRFINKRTASQSSDYYWTAENFIMTADLAISGTSTDTFGGKTCSVTQANPIQYVAWWMLTFSVDPVYIKNVQIYYRSTSEYFFSYKYFFQVHCRGGSRISS